MTEGQIYLDYDIMLDNFNPTGTEEMLAQVWNWESQEWSTVSTYSNVDGSFDWVSEHVDITDETMSTVFKIRFAATGESSLNILGWYVDNIQVYRECKTPYGLSVELVANQNEMGFLVEWENPYGLYNNWIEWDDGINSGNSIGTGSEIEFDVAARWTPVQLYVYEGATVEQVAFFPAEATAEYRIRIWTGAGAANMIVDQLVENPLIGHWNDILLNSPVIIDVTQELWVGYHVNTQTGYPAGVDNGPAIDGYGNMMNFGGWQTLLEINPELDFNWNIKAYLNRGNINMVTKYAVYRSNDGAPYFFRAFSEVERYLDESDLCEFSDVICFYVTAIYSSDTDSCESNPSNHSCELCPGFIENKLTSKIKIYPNPASDVLFIESKEKIESLTIFDSRGITIEQWNNRTMEQWNGERVEIPVGDLLPGLYLVKVETGGGVLEGKSW
jgi:hypothetical protein